MRAHRVRALLMGGQACVFYGAAEFSRDRGLAIVADAANLARLRLALNDLQAEAIAVPPLDLKHLRRGHAIHFRCRHPEAWRMRVDLMAKMRGVDAFPKLWKRRTTIELPDGTRRFERGFTHFIRDYAPLANRWAVWDNVANPPELRADSETCTPMELQSMLLP